MVFPLPEHKPPTPKYENNLYYRFFYDKARLKIKYYEDHYDETKNNPIEKAYRYAYIQMLHNTSLHFRHNNRNFTIQLALDNFNKHLASYYSEGVAPNMDQRFIGEWMDDTQPSEKDDKYTVTDRAYIMHAHFKDMEVFVNRMFVRKSEDKLEYKDPTDGFWYSIPQTPEYSKFYILKTIYFPHFLPSKPVMHTLDARAWSASVQVMLEKEKQEAEAADLPPDPPEGAKIDLISWYNYESFQTLHPATVFKVRMELIKTEINFYIEKKYNSITTMLRSIVYYSEDRHFWDAMNNYCHASGPYSEYTPWKYAYKDCKFVDKWVMEHVYTILKHAPGINHEMTVRRALVRSHAYEEVYMYVDGKNITENLYGNLELLPGLLTGKTVMPWKNQVISVAYTDAFEWKKNPQNIYCVITLPKGTPATCLAPHQPAPGKLNLHEWVLPMNSLFHVDKVEKENGDTIVYMTYVDKLNSWNNKLTALELFDIIVQQLAEYYKVYDVPENKYAYDIVREIRKLIK